MKHLKLFENFNDSIESICKEFNIKNWTVNSDGTVDVKGNVCLDSKGLSKLPLKFGKVSGVFSCDNNYLKTLEGSPSQVGASFKCSNNKLITLEGSPSYVGGNFFCSDNILISLKGAPNEVGGYFICYRNQLINLEGAPRESIPGIGCNHNPIFQIYKLFPNHKSYLDSVDYNYLRGTNIVKSRFKEALDEIGIELPEIIEGYKYI